MSESSPTISPANPLAWQQRRPTASKSPAGSRSLNGQSLAQAHQELRERSVVGIPVLLLPIAMAFVGRQQVPDLAALGANRVHDRFCFAHGNSRIVLALNDEQRPGNALGVGERRDAPQKTAHFGIALVAVFR